MARTHKDSRGRRSSTPRRISVRGVQRDPVDIRKLSRALISLAQAQAEADAAQQAKAKQPKPQGGERERPQ